MTQRDPILSAFAQTLHAHDRSETTIKHYLSDLDQLRSWFKTHSGESFLGHSRLETTARYSQPSEEDLAEAAERLR